MMNRYLSRVMPLLTLIVSGTLALQLSGCLAAGAAAGAAVGGCALLDANEDEQVTMAEMSDGLYDAWDTDGDSELTRDEFQAGVSQHERYQPWSVEYGNWDADDDNMLSRSEFRTGVAGQSGTESWLDDQCDDLGL